MAGQVILFQQSHVHNTSSENTPDPIDVRYILYTIITEIYDLFLYTSEYT